jgi:hypothetical protein
MSVDPAIWRRRAELTITWVMADAIDAGVTIDHIERVVRSFPSPFGAEPTRANRFYLKMLDDAFPPARRRKKGG